jgi:hypothetical protein
LLDIWVGKETRFPLTMFRFNSPKKHIIPCMPRKQNCIVCGVGVGVGGLCPHPCPHNSCCQHDLSRGVFIHIACFCRSLQLQAPGQTFEYTSVCPLRTPSGSMQGHYEFYAKHEDAYTTSFLVDIAEFALSMEGPRVV